MSNLSPEDQKRAEAIERMEIILHSQGFTNAANPKVARVAPVILQDILNEINDA